MSPNIYIYNFTVSGALWSLTEIFSSYGKEVLEFVSWSSFRQVMSSQNTSLIGLFYKNLGSVWRVSDCEELVG